MEENIKNTSENTIVENIENVRDNTNDEQNIENEEKTFTQAELDAIINKRLAKKTKEIEAAKQKEMDSRLKAELEEASKLEKMSEAERVKAKAEKEAKIFAQERAKFDEEMKAFNQEKILTTTMKTLSEKGLPVEFASFIKADNADDVMENIVNFEKGFNDAVSKAVSERLKGNAPKTATTKTSVTKEEFNKMNYNERMSLYSANKDLYNKLKK